MYINCHTWYSLRFGTFSEIELLEMAKEQGVKQLVLTDINNTSACLNFIRKSKDYAIKPIIGIDYRNNVRQLYVGIAKNNQGFYELNTFLSKYTHVNDSFPEIAPCFKNAYIIYSFEQVLLLDKTDFEPHEFIGVSIKDLRKLPFSIYREMKDKLVVLQTVTFRNKRDHNIHRLLRAIDNNTLLSKLQKEEEADPNEVMLSKSEIVNAFLGYEHIIANTETLMNSCAILFDFSEERKTLNKQTYTEDKQKDLSLIRELCIKGLGYRYPNGGDSVLERLDKELSVIEKMDFVSYFLINWDIVSYARKQGYFYVGRGSGANSIVAYLLGITDVDPLDLDLYFERFINLYRTSPPDFDIDFSWRDREDMTRYIFERFEHTALLGTYVTFKYRGIVRELGKVFGLPKEEIDRLCEGRYALDQLDTFSRLVVRYASLMQGIPNYLSIHAGGILISEHPIHYFTATDLPPKGFPTTQFDMVVAEDVGLYKFDILGQRGLAKIKETLEIITYNRPNEADFDIHNIDKFKKDKRINELIKTAECMGCFYVESPAMRMLLKKLEVDNYLGLVAASSIIRPGVAKSGMMREYILRHRDPNRRKKAHPVMQSIMPDTYGIMVYQEDVIKVAHYFAGLTLSEADVLRRGMSGKYRSREEFKNVENKFIANCKEKGYDTTLIYEIWNQISSFAGYAFAKGHSASYAVESYQSLFLKAYFPLEYMVATLNNGGGFYRPEFYIYEAEMLGATIYAPCINNSHYHNCIIGTHIYLGFGLLKELESRVIERLVKERKEKGDFVSLDDFIDRVAISVEQISILIRINAFGFTNKDKYELLWQAHFKLEKTKNINDIQARLFTSSQQKYTIPVLKTTLLEVAFDQLELLGFCINSPFNLLAKKTVTKFGAVDMKCFIGKHIDIYGYLVTVKNTKTHTGKRMNFATFIDQYGQVFDTVLFPLVAKNNFFRGKGIYRIYGKVVNEFGFLSIETVKMVKQDYILDPRYADS